MLGSSFQLNSIAQYPVPEILLPSLENLASPATILKVALTSNPFAGLSSIVIFFPLSDTLIGLVPLFAPPSPT